MWSIPSKLVKCGGTFIWALNIGFHWKYSTKSLSNALENQMKNLVNTPATFLIGLYLEIVRFQRTLPNNIINYCCYLFHHKCFSLLHCSKHSNSPDVNYLFSSLCFWPIYSLSGNISISIMELWLKAKKGRYCKCMFVGFVSMSMCVCVCVLKKALNIYLAHCCFKQLLMIVHAVFFAFFCHHSHPIRSHCIESKWGSKELQKQFELKV